MPETSDSILASLLLTDRTLEREAKPLSAKEYWSIRDAVDDPAELLGQDAAMLATTTGLAQDWAERLAALLDSATQLAFHLERFQQSGVSALTPFNTDYPDRLMDRLGTAAPPILYIVGPTSLLNCEGIGVVGSRHMPDGADHVARRAAELAVREDLTIISGGAKGIDQVAMTTGARRGGSVVGILADSMERTVRDPETQHLIAEERLCMATPYKPSMGFTAANAMGRNKLIYALSTRTLVVCSDLDKGGTWSGATEALKRDFGNVVVWMGHGKGSGNEAIESAGATGIRDIGDLLIVSAEPESAPEHEQLTLDV